MRWHLITSLAGVTATVACAAAPKFYTSRPPVLCSVPDRDYQYKKFSRTERSWSAVAVPGRLAELPGQPPQIDPDVRLYQFIDQPVLQIDHCVVSEMAMEVSKDGKWVFSCRAEQNPTEINPFRVGADVTTSQPIELYTQPLLRNEFYLELRCYSAAESRDPADLLGKPVLLRIPIQPFWVQKGVPYTCVVRGCSALQAKIFERADRVVVEFRYRVN